MQPAKEVKETARVAMEWAGSEEVVTDVHLVPMELEVLGHSRDESHTSMRILLVTLIG